MGLLFLFPPPSSPPATVQHGSNTPRKEKKGVRQGNKVRPGPGGLCVCVWTPPALLTLSALSCAPATCAGLSLRSSEGRMRETIAFWHGEETPIHPHAGEIRRAGKATRALHNFEVAGGWVLGGFYVLLEVLVYRRERTMTMRWGRPLPTDHETDTSFFLSRLPLLLSLHGGSAGSRGASIRPSLNGVKAEASFISLSLHLFIFVSIYSSSSSYSIVLCIIL